MSGDENASSAAELFELLWETLADVLGTAAAATLLRRAIKRTTSPVVVVRNGPDYEYCLPETWRQPGNEEARQSRHRFRPYPELDELVEDGRLGDARRLANRPARRLGFSQCVELLYQASVLAR